MSAADIEPLEPGLWFEALEKLLHRQENVGDGELPALLRHGFHLLQLTPRPLRSLVRPSADEATFERYLEARAIESAALALLAPPISFRLSARDPHRVEARVWLPGDGAASVVLAHNVASALVGAWARCLLDLGARALSPAIRGPAPHRGPGEPHPTQSRH